MKKSKIQHTSETCSLSEALEEILNEPKNKREEIPQEELEKTYNVSPDEDPLRCIDLIKIWGGWIAVWRYPVGFFNPDYIPPIGIGKSPKQAFGDWAWKNRNYLHVIIAKS